MLSAWTEGQILKNIPSAYKFVYTKVNTENLQTDEEVFFAGYGCSAVKQETELSKGFFVPASAVSVISRVVFITSYRYIVAYLEYGRGLSKGVSVRGKSVVYRRTGGSIINFDRSSYAQWEWIPPLQDTPRDTVVFIKEWSLSSFSKVRGRNDYNCRWQGQEIDLVEIETDKNTWLVFQRDDGNRVYELLQHAAKNNGMLRSDKVYQVTQEKLSASVVEQLEKLASLHEMKVLTTPEYELAKKRLLGK